MKNVEIHPHIQNAFGTAALTHFLICINVLAFILLTKITAVQNEAALSYQRVPGLHFPAVIFAATIVHL